MGEARPRLLWLNGPHYVGKRTLARTMRDEWGVPLLDAGAIGSAIQGGMPPQRGLGDVQAFRLGLWCMWRVGVEMARSFGLVTMPGAVHRPELVNELLEEFRRVEVDVLHVIIEATDAELRSRIHAHVVPDDAKRWALEHRVASVEALAGVREGIRLDSTRRTPHQLAGDIARALIGQGWLTADLAWTGGGRR